MSLNRIENRLPLYTMANGGRGSGRIGSERVYFLENQKNKRIFEGRRGIYYTDIAGDAVWKVISLFHDFFGFFRFQQEFIGIVTNF